MLAGSIAAVCTLIAVYTVAMGPWRLTIAGATLRVSSIDRLLMIAISGWLAFTVSSSHRWLQFRERSTLTFYAGATAAVMLFCMGPVIRNGDTVVLKSAPYRWLLILPGFDSLRVPTRFWMLGAMCLATAAALAFDRLAPRERKWRAALLTIACAGVLADAWIPEMPMAPAPQPWREVERLDTDRPLMELPLGPEFDAAATYRAVGHRRRVVNGVSGYDPPHYEWLQRGLSARDPGVLAALASFGSLDIVVDRSTEEGRALAMYVSSARDVERVTDDGVRTLYRLPAAASASIQGRAVPLLTVRASSGDPAAVLDGRLGTSWALARQTAGEWIRIDLGSARAVEGVTTALGDPGGYPRSFSVELSLDAETWETAWEGGGFQYLLTGLMQTPRSARVAVGFPPRSARYVRLRLMAAADAPWTIAEITVHESARPTPTATGTFSSSPFARGPSPAPARCYRARAAIHVEMSSSNPGTNCLSSVEYSAGLPVFALWNR